jgi:hypothetical protein
MMKAIRSWEKSVLTGGKRRNFPEESILYHRRKNRKSHKGKGRWNDNIREDVKRTGFCDGDAIRRAASVMDVITRARACASVTRSNDVTRTPRALVKHFRPSERVASGPCPSSHILDTTKHDVSVFR